VQLANFIAQQGNDSGRLMRRQNGASNEVIQQEGYNW